VFLGEYRHTLDAKGRVSLPARYRASMTGSLVLAKGFEKSLMVYTSTGYAEFLARVLDMDEFKGKARELQRYFTANAVELDLDGAGRISVPAAMREWAGLTKDVVVVGAGERAELWNPSQWDAYRTRTEGAVADIAEELSDLGLF
jgi:MraZ protein